MKHLINREDYIREFLRVNMDVENMIEVGKETDNELYEGLLNTLFGGLKMLFKKDWANIKCKNPTVLSHLKEMDSKLSGFTMMKMQYSNECNNIRQNVADYFNDILDYKLMEVEKAENPDKFVEKEEKEGEDNKLHNSVANRLKIKDKTLLDSLKKYKDNISTACKPNPKLREYSDQLLNSVVVFVNDIVIAELEKKGLDKDKIKEMQEKNNEEERRLEEERRKKDEEAKKAYEEALKKLKDERDKSLTDLNIKPIGDNEKGDSAIQKITTEFEGVLKNFEKATVNESKLPGNYGEILDGDTHLGLRNSLEEIEWKFDKYDTTEDTYQLFERLLIRVILNKVNAAFSRILDNKNEFVDTPGISAQAMLVSIANAIIYGYVGSNFKVDNNSPRLSLMTKCLIDSDPTIGFCLPPIDKSKPEDGNYFLSIMNVLNSGNVSSKEVVDVVQTMTPEERKKLYEIWNKSKDEEESNGDSGKNNEENSNDESKENKKELDPKHDEFAKEFAEVFGEDIMSDFKKNIDQLFKFIQTESEKIKEKAKKEKEAAAAKEQQESESNEGE